MQYLSISGTSKPVSQIIKGTDYLLLDDYEELCEQFDQYVLLGGNTFDTAHIYTEGESERVVGKYLFERKNREEIVVLTKGGIPDAAGRSRLGHSAIAEQINISLERLQMDHIDLYALHRDDAQIPVGQILEMMNEHVEAGRIRAFGASNWTTKRLQEAQEYAASHQLIGFSFNSPNFSLALPNEPFWGGCVEADDEMRSWHEQNKLPLLSWSPLARGFFSGKYTPDHLEDADMVRVFYNEQNWKKYGRAMQLAEQKNCSVAEIALAFLLNQSYPVGTVAGAKSIEELKSCYKAAEIRLTPEELKWLDLKENN